MSTTIIEALEAAREAFADCPACGDRLAKIDAALAQARELQPVAWLNPHSLECGYGVVDWEDTGCTPLYAAPLAPSEDALDAASEVAVALAGGYSHCFRHEETPLIGELWTKREGYSDWLERVGTALLTRIRAARGAPPAPAAEREELAKWCERWADGVDACQTDERRRYPSSERMRRIAAILRGERNV